MSVAAAIFSLSAIAADPSVVVQADVVFASTAPGTVDPSLTRMRDQMAPKVKYTTMKKLDSKRLELVQNKPQTISLPNQKQAELTLQQLKENIATVKVKSQSVRFFCFEGLASTSFSEAASKLNRSRSVW